MPAHEHFEELCALAAIGQLTPEEHIELLQHLRVCPGCKHASDDFALILDQLPLTEPAPPKDNLDCLQTTSYRERFLRRAQVEGVHFTSQVLSNNIRTRAWSWPRFVWRQSYTVVCTIAVAAFVVGAVCAYQVLANKIVATHLVVTSAPSAVPSAPPSKDADLGHLQAMYARAERRIETLQGELARAEQERSELAVQSERDRQALAELQDRIHQYEQYSTATAIELDRLRSSKEETTAALVASETRLRDLDDQLKVQKAAVEQERQLTAAAKDVRQLMGARNLHIIDVFDADGSGRAQKSFGRVFYSEGKSLIFYAFDLEQRKQATSKVSFQAWGQREANKNISKNLGMFFIDDHSQKRWVLKVDDPEKLKGIDSVFVTVEPLGGVDKPSGKKLLYAYLGSQANHP